MLNSIEMAMIHGPAVALAGRATVVKTPPRAFSAAPEHIDPDQSNMIRIFSLYMGVALLFCRVSNFQQTLTFLLGTNFGLLYVIGIPAILGSLLCGGIRRVLRSRRATYWIVFTLWLALAIPFSSWSGGSFSSTVTYFRTNAVLLFIVGGLPLTWKECHKMTGALFWGAIASVMASGIFEGGYYGDRFSLEFGSIANPNDFAAHLLFCLPFLYLSVISSKWKAARIVSLGMLCYGLYVLIQTASRGAFVGLVAVALGMLLWSTNRQRIALIVFVPLAFSAAIIAIPSRDLARIVTFSSDDPASNEEALSSSARRKYLLDKSIEYTLQHPIFGVGPFQFPSYEGRNNQTIGTHGAYQQTHNSFTQVSSECGIPGLILYVAGLVAAFRTFYKTYREAHRRPNCRDIQNTAMCLMLSMVGFTVAFAFLSLAYGFYMPIFVGLAVAISAATKGEFQERAAQAQESAETGAPRCSSGAYAGRPSGANSAWRYAGEQPRLLSIHTTRFGEQS